MRSRDIRRGFLEFFESAGHKRVASASLVPGDDPTLLFTNAGMNQFKDVFLGKEKRDYARATTTQKCMRVSGKHNDLDNVGPSPRHHTFFEMLGNFSFGDYFKGEAIPYAWHLLTAVWQIPPERLYATIFMGEPGVPRDDEAYDLWRKFLPADRIGELGAEDNFWQMGDTGPCGRCSEIYYLKDDGSMMEIWNNVFMEFDRQPGGALDPLPARSIDTGMGLERVTAVLQGVESNYDTDLFQPLLQDVATMCGQPYTRTDAASTSMRVIADHMRASTFLIADGVIPSNEWRGYVLRKIMRRAMRHGKKLGITEPFMHALADRVVSEMGDAYPELRANRDSVVKVIRSEEERFDAVLSAGLGRLEQVLDRAAASASKVVPGDEMFRLYDSLGLPLDFIEDLAGERQLAVDRAGYDAAMEAQRERARAGSHFEVTRAQGFTVSGTGTQAALDVIGDRFEGYDLTEVSDAKIVALFDADRREVPALDTGATGFVVLDRTPFYVESGGQVSDVGTLTTEDGAATVQAMSRLVAGGPRVHHVTIDRGILRASQHVSARVDLPRRTAIRRNHTATHLLHAALRQTLGPHVKQAGSLVAPDRLRFDFVHTGTIAASDLDAIERLVNTQVMRNTNVQTTLRRTDEAMALGAMALFGEKYGDTVRVVDIPGYSLELCGGTHCRATGDIGIFTIVSESGVAAGVRRIEAVTGDGALALLQDERRQLQAVSTELHAAPADAAETAGKLQAEIKRLTRALHEAKVKAALGAGDASSGQQTHEVAGVKVVTRRVDGVDRTALRELADQIKAGLGSGVVVLAANAEGKVSFVVSVTSDLTARVKAGDMVKRLGPIVGGGGGGRPDFAEAGGKQPEQIDALLTAAPQAVQDALAATAR
ncbi:alanine--tRNA ligase [Luteitalea sp.]|uniref:alanine--tRNA ligase n=1 Tax=Luteitalea sp. TaxID=2004800 RepID=UPI0025B9068A|nr:alanine--tRNA ligase [Luteitalea sp.]